jgi:hypothetical protein
MSAAGARRQRAIASRWAGTFAGLALADRQAGHCRSRPEGTTGSAASSARGCRNVGQQVVVEKNRAPAAYRLEFVAAPLPTATPCTSRRPGWRSAATSSSLSYDPVADFAPVT